MRASAWPFVRPWAALALVGWGLACGGGPPGGAGMAAAPVSACLPVADSLAPGASLAGMAGRYRLIMRQDTDDGTRSAEGTLSLWPRPEGSQALEGASTPLMGSAAINLDAAGAVAVRELGSEDPSAPGILVIEREAAGRPSVLLRLGSESNQQGVSTFDGAYTVLAVTRIDDNGFVGSWRSGVRARRTTGYFCAWRVAQ